MENLPEKSREKNWAEVLSKADLLDTVCSHIENGGSLITWCERYDIPYSYVMRWLRLEKSRTEAYDRAVEARKEWMVERLTNELTSISTIDIRRAFNSETGFLLEPKDMPDDIAKALSAVDVDDEGRVKVRMWDKLKAMEMLGKTLRMFIDRVEHSGALTLEEMVAGTLQIDDAAPKQ